MVSRSWRQPSTPEPPGVQKSTFNQEKNGHQRVARRCPRNVSLTYPFFGAGIRITSIASISRLFSLCSEEFSIYYWTFAFDVLFICNFRLNWGFFLLVWAALRARDSFMLGVKRIITGNIFAQLFLTHRAKPSFFTPTCLEYFNRNKCFVNSLHKLYLCCLRNGL